TAAAPPVLDFVHVEANEDGSSGGHAALGVGGEIFHYEYEPPGWLRLSRETAGAFERHYLPLENPSIHVRRIPVDEETPALVRDELVRRHVAQAQQDAMRADLHADVELLAALVEQSRHGEAAGTVALDGPGFFFAPAAEATPAGGEPALVLLRARLV